MRIIKQSKSIVWQILEELWQTELNYKGMRVNLFGIPKFNYNKKSSFKASVYRMKRDGFILGNTSGFYLTPKGKKYLEKKYDSLKQFSSSFSKDSKKDLIVMFDVPESKKAEREWLRWHLKKFGYNMIQKSVWVGPSPLPVDFMSYLKEIKIDKTLKTFKLPKAYFVK